MAKSLDGATKVNPRFLQGDFPGAADVIPSDAATYIAGELVALDANGKVVAIADDTPDVSHVMASARSAALTATPDKAFEITPETRLVMMVVDGTTDAAATRAMVGSLYSIEVISNVAVVDLDSGTAHSNDIFRVDGLMADLEPERHAIADSPGQVYGHFIATATTDVNAA